MNSQQAKSLFVRIGYYSLWLVALTLFAQLLIGFLTQEGRLSALKVTSVNMSNKNGPGYELALKAYLESLQKSPLFYPVEVKKKITKPKAVKRQAPAPGFSDKVVSILGNKAYFSSGKEVEVGGKIGAATLVSLNGPVATIDFNGKKIEQSVLDGYGESSSSKDKSGSKKSSRSSRGSRISSSQKPDISNFKDHPEIVKLMVTNTWLREDGKGESVRFSFKADGTSDTGGRSSWRVWGIKDGKITFQGGSRGIYSFNADKTKLTGISPYSRKKYTLTKQ